MHEAARTGDSTALFDDDIALPFEPQARYPGTVPTWSAGGGGYLFTALRCVVPTRAHEILRRSKAAMTETCVTTERRPHAP